MEVNSHRCLWWKNILQHQYEVYSEFVEEYIAEGNERELCALNNKVQTVLLHINQATTPIYEVPYHNYYYSGSYNDILKMYYGIIATIFNIAYNLPRNGGTYQHEIAYSVDFEAATEVHSDMYTMKSDTKRFVVFHLPYEAFMKFDKTVKLLLHEVFHYVAPFDRPNRNFIFIKVLIICVFERYMAYLDKIGLTQENQKNITEYFYKNYGELCKTIDEQIDKKFYTFILNDFTATKNSKLSDISEKICEIICNKITEDLGLWLNDVKDYCTFKHVYLELFDIKDERYQYIIEKTRRTALAAKEAFCDLNMIYILDMPLNEYLILLYNALYGKYNKDKVRALLNGLIEKDDISIGSFELRLGMVLNYYLNQSEHSEPEKYIDSFKKEINEIIQRNSEIPNAFYNYLIAAYQKYLSECRNELSLHKELFYKEVQWFSLYKNNRYNQDKLKKAVSCLKHIDDNVEVICDFKDIEIDESKLNTNNTFLNVKRYASIESTLTNVPLEVNNLGQYVDECCKIIEGWGDEIIWFRGACRASYDLTPSIFRNIDSELSLYANQARYLKGAYYATISESTLWTEQLKSGLEHMCFLQHYGMPTSLLDFSDDMLMALHFALNPDNPDDLRDVDEHVAQPKVVLFNPFVYNEAVISLQTGRPTEQPRNISPILLDVKDDQLLDYYVHDMSKEYLNKHSVEHTVHYEPNPRTNLYPLPIAIRRSNARINAQNGIFVAYNLSANPERDGKAVKKYYSYLALERIQEDYIKLLEERNESLEKGVFIRELYINKMAVSTIKSQLKTMNITTARAYPETFRVFAEYMDKVNK